MLRYVFSAHLRLAVHAALLFAVGLFVSWPVVHYRLRAMAWLPMAVFRLAMRLLGPSPSILRTWAVIVTFNATAMFLYMGSGFHPLLPKAFGIWVGMNIGIILGMGRQEQFPMTRAETAGPQWVPSARLTAICGLAVLLIELPCFWYCVALGISMGHVVQGGLASYPAALALRAGAYVTVLLPLLMASALAEAIAIRGSLARVERP
jgi:hypothetical protein